MVKVTFSEDRVVQDEHVGTDRETKFIAGKVYDLDQTSADRWRKRGVATLAEDKSALPAGSDAGEGQGGGAEVEIPDDWANLHHATKRKLAREISGTDPADLDAAEAVIAAEVARRAAQG